MLEFEDMNSVQKIIDQKVARFKYDTESEGYSLMLEYRDAFLDGREALTGKRDFDYI